MPSITDSITYLDIIQALNDNSTEVSGKQDELVSGDNIKTVNSASILGEGDLEVASTAQGSKADTALQPEDVSSTYSATGTVPINGTAVAQAISPITTVIPSAASSTNQLADKNFVNSSISTNTAVFRGTFDSVEALNAYAGEKTNNDYAFVETTDSAGNNFYDRYKYNGSAWVYEFKINNTTFTSVQWEALDSGVNTTVVAKATSALQQSDVVSTYSATGTSPVNGTAVAGALATLDIPVVDQTYNAVSTNAQSGVAIASALANINVDVDQTYSATSTIAQSGTAVAEALLTLDIPSVDQTYLASSTNAQSGTAVAEAISSILPSQTGQSGKFLTTDGTVASWAEVQGGNVASGNAGYTAFCPALTLSDGKLTWVVTHNLNTEAIIASLYTSAGAELMKDVTIDSVNQITVTFVAGANASAGDYKIVVMSTRSFAIDSSLSATSTNPVENSVITEALNDKEDILKTVNVLDTSGTITLSDNSINSITPSGNITFTLPTITDNTVFHEIMVQINLSTVYTIDVGTTYYFNKTAPDLSGAGTYNLYYEYDKANEQWYCGVLSKGTVS